MLLTRKYMRLTYINHSGDSKITSTTLLLDFPSPSEPTFRWPNRTFFLMILKILLFMVSFPTKFTKNHIPGKHWA